MASYRTIYSTEAVTSTLGGVGIGIPAAGMEANEIPLLQVDGSVKHDTGPLAIDDGQYDFTGVMKYLDPEDPELGVYFSDGAGGAFTLEAFTGQTFDYVLRYFGQYPVDGVYYDAEGVAGIVTQDADMPISGTADYTGVALGSGGTTGGTFELLSGSSAATVDFGAGTLSMRADGFDDIGQPVDEIRVVGATIDGASFSGGTVLILHDGTSVEGILGANVETQFGGRFFGYDDTQNIPDEVGGMVLKAGDDGYVSVYFAAD